ncbi:hypothetical protein [Ottowia sp.]|uniref:hypothetical protein n=1 Tax=Ottowia sp. TaxID=1898956 RepID=UPI0025FCB011|nr:hypothetical protein [Ottowia sp.]MBK6616124.1 hypothetical protein [Ottowia sp.]
MKQATVAVVGKDTRPGSHFVIGYSPVLISQDAKRRLNDFRLSRIPVDLRIERSMVSAAVELSLADQELKDLMVQMATERVATELEAGVPSTGNPLPGYTGVLIKDQIKHDLRYFGSRHTISGDWRQTERVLATAAIEIVLKCERLHEKWVELISSTVGWEVGHCFRSARIGS